MTGEIKVGDAVRLRIDGPLMVVVSVYKTPSGTVMVGCEPLDKRECDRIEIPLYQLVLHS